MVAQSVTNLRRTVSAALVALVMTSAGRASDPELMDYVGDALDIMERHALVSSSVDWPAFRERSLRLAAAARHPAQAREVVDQSLSRLGDGHSFLMAPERAQAWRHAGDPEQAALPSAESMERDIAYLALPAFDTADELAMQRFVRRVHQLIAQLGSGEACGWVLDLRDNSGGNLWPLLVAAGPLLGPGTAGGFKRADGSIRNWGYDDGSAWLGGEVLLRARDEPPMFSPVPAVAVLTGPGTASAGEALAVAFRGRPGAASFGRPTRGLSTINRSFPLEDGAIMMLTTALLMDRAGRTYGHSLSPDREIETAALHATHEDGAALSAWAWLRTQSGCRG